MRKHAVIKIVAQERVPGAQLALMSECLHPLSLCLSLPSLACIPVYPELLTDKGRTGEEDMRQDLGLSKLQAQRVIAHLHRSFPWQSAPQDVEADNGSGGKAESCSRGGEDDRPARDARAALDSDAAPVSGACSRQSSLGPNTPDRLFLRGGGACDTEAQGSSSTCGASRCSSHGVRGGHAGGPSDSSLNVVNNVTAKAKAPGKDESVVCSHVATCLDDEGLPGAGKGVEPSERGGGQCTVEGTKSSHGDVSDWSENTWERMVREAFENETLDFMAAYRILGIPQDPEG
jgi:hypothetical protein